MNFQRERKSDQMFYIVFASVKRPIDFSGGRALDWGQPPVGVYQADTPEEACEAAASDRGSMSTYAAVECVPWGVDLDRNSARQLGKQTSGNERMADILERMEENNRRLAEIESHKREPTPAERLAAAEAKTREMEREAGIDQADE